MRTIKLTTEAIRRLAIEQLGCVDATVVRYTARQTCFDTDLDTEARTEINRGRWYALSVQWHRGGEREVIARRRTQSELVELIARRTIRGQRQAG